MSSRKKTAAARKVINEAIRAMVRLGIPLDSDTERRRELAAMCLLAVARVTHSADWPSLANYQGPGLGTRQIIVFINEHFGERISKGSYDDIRRKHLKKACLAGMVITTASTPNPAPNDPTRGYALAPEYASLLARFGQEGWEELATAFMRNRVESGVDSGAKRSVSIEPLLLPDGRSLTLSPGSHNLLQRAILEQFRPRFAPGSTLLYLGDSTDRVLVHETDTLQKIGLRLPPSGVLPDVVLWDASRRWIFFIEAVHTFGPISSQRRVELTQLCGGSSAAPVFVTAFLDRQQFRKFAVEIAWETEVWIADEPDHMIHFNGDRFYGPRE